MNLQEIKMTKILLTITFFLTMCTATMAQTSLFAGPYLGVNIGYNSFKSDGLVDNINGISFGGFGGYRAPVSENVVVGVEGFFDVNRGKQDFTVLGGAEFKVSESVGIRIQTVWQDFDSASSIGGSAGVVFNF